jgi:glycosyltransferase involved in cell wall biosynthesis/peptidoglycan/xylan/chitin deacetylase (PgdA/CDA1 family)
MRKPIPIAIFVDRYAPGGTQRQMIELLTRLDRRRFRVHPVCFHPDGLWFKRVANLGDPVALFPIHGFRRLGTARQLLAFASWCRTNQIELLQTCELYSNIFGLAGGTLASVPLRIASRRGFVEPPGLQRLQRASYSQAQYVVANSNAAADQLRAEEIPEEKIVVIPNGIDLNSFPPRDYSRPPRCIAMVACLREEKRIDVLMSAIPAVLTRYPDARLLICGDGPCRGALVAQARELKILDKVQFLGHRDDVANVLAEADLFVLPSRTEAFPNSVMEAMAAGLPVVASDVGGIPELVEDTQTGHLVPPGDSTALAQSLIGLIERPERIEELGRAARRRVEQTYSFGRMVSQFETLYETQLDARRCATQWGGSGTKRLIKATLMNAYLASGYPTLRNQLLTRLGRTWLTVLTYHQVKSPADDCSSVSPEEFRRQMQFLQSQYTVLPLSQAVDLANPGIDARVVAITFDDGYLDNATIAAPILRALGLPATFFVATDMVGRSQPFPHDVIQHRHNEKHMSWDDLRSLVAQGFEIGSHTCRHADLGAVSLADARRELRASRERLEQELGIAVRHFAFPYGRRRNMRPDIVAAARAEYDVCCSAYGGHNTVPVNRGNVRRVVISTGVSFLGFRAILEGWPILRTNNPYRASEQPTEQPAV